MKRSLAVSVFFDDMAPSFGMRLLVIGMDREVAKPESASAKRQAEYYQGWDAEIVVVGPGKRGIFGLSHTVRAVACGGGSRPMAWLNAAWTVMRLCRAKPYDVITVQDPFFSGWLGMWGRLFRPTARLHVQDHSGAFARTSVGRKDRVLRLLGRFVARSADRVRTVSERGKRGLISAGVLESRIDVVPVATDISRFLSVEGMRDTNNVLCISRLEKEKGVDVLLAAFEKVKRIHPDLTLTIVGDGSMRSFLDKGKPGVTFVGSQADVRPYLERAGTYVQPSRYEGWGIAVIEAAAAGLPIVMTDVGCAGEVIVDGKSGWVVPPSDEEALSKALIGAITNREEAKRRGLATREAVLAMPSVSAASERVRGSLLAASSAERITDPTVWLFLVSFIVRVGALLLIVAFAGSQGLQFGDSEQYLGLAQSLVEGEGFVLDGVAFAYRTIGYPAILAGLIKIGFSLHWISVLQCLVAATVPFLIQTLGKMWGFDAKTRRRAAWISVFEPHLVFYTPLILTEWIMVPLTLLVLVLITRAMQRRRPSDSIIAGIVFGASLLVKPILQLFPAFIFVGLLLQRGFRSSVKAWGLFAIGMFAALVVIFPWLWRSHQTFGTWSLSNQGQAAAVSYLGSSILSVADHVSYEEGERRVRLRLGTRTDYTTIAVGIVREHPSAFVRVMATNAVSFWTGHNYAYLLYYYHLIPDIDRDVLPPTHYLVQGRFGDFFSSFASIFGQPFYLIGALGRALWAFILVLSLFALWKRRPWNVGDWLTVGIALCFTATVAVNGLGVEGRLRMPLMPLQILYALAAFSTFRKKSSGRGRLLVITQRVDAQDRNLAIHVRWLKFFAEQRDQVNVIAQSVGSHDLPTNVRVASLGKEHGASKPKQLLRFWRHAWRMVGDSDRVIVLMSPLYVLLVWPIAFLRGKPIYLWYTHKHVPFVLRVALLLVQNVFSASPESFRLKTTKVRFFGHAIDTDFFAPSSAARDPKRLVTVGRITASKRIDVMIEAVKKLKDVRLEVIGEPIMKEDHVELDRLKVIVQRDGLSDRVTFIGGVSPEEVRRVYQNAAVCLNASKTGSLDKALLEAMACGCPVVTSNEAFAKIAPEGFVTGDFVTSIEKVLAAPTDSVELRRRIVEGHSMRKTLTRVLDTMRGM